MNIETKNVWYRTMLLGVTLCLHSAGIQKSLAQDSEGTEIANAYDAGVRALDAEKYQEGLKIVDETISKYGGTAPAKVGPIFGHFYYLKGMLCIRLEDYNTAIEAFDVCYSQYTNDVSNISGMNSGVLRNRFRVQSLVQWGGCLLYLKDYDGAAEKYKTALAMKERYEPRINRFETQVNLAKALLLSDNWKEGKDFILKQMANPNLKPDLKRALFLILMNDWSHKVPFEEVRPHIDEYRYLMSSETVVNRYRKQNQVLHRLAGLALQSNEPVRALTWYSMMVHPGEVSKFYTAKIDEIEGRVKHAEIQKGTEEYVAAQKKLVEELRPEIEKQRTQMSHMLLGIGACHYSISSLSGARSAYLELAEHFPDLEQRPIVLHNLVVCSVKLSHWKEAYKFGLMFFKEFPNHELKGSVARVLVEVIFFQKQYQKAFNVASDVRGGMEVASKDRESPDFVVGGSLFHLGKYEEADVEIQTYLETYPNGTRREPMMFYRGSTKVNLQKWAEAAKYLDEFLTAYPESQMRSAALYLAGLSHMILENYEEAEKRIIELQTEHPQAAEVPAACNILGDINSAKENLYEDIIPHYLQAKKYVEEEGRGDIEVAGYAIRQLMNEANAQQEWKLSAGYYDEFMERYEASTWKADVSIAAVNPLVETGRKEEAKEILINFVNLYADKPGSTEFDQMFGTYADFLKSQYDLEDQRKNLKNFPANTDPPTPALRAWLYMAEIEALSDADPKKFDKDIQQSFYRLNALYDMNGKKLSNYTLVKLARWNSQKRGKDDQARKVYEFILEERPSGEAMGFALVDLAKLEAKNNSLTAAKRLFNRVLKETEDDSMHEDAVLGLARIAFDEKTYDESLSWWKRYRDRSGAWKKARAEASYKFGACLNALGKKDEAAATFVNVYSNYPGQLDWSTKAYIETATIVRSNGAELDALKLLREMIQRMGHLEHPEIERGRELFKEWRTDYIAKVKK